VPLAFLDEFFELLLLHRFNELLRLLVGMEKVSAERDLRAVASLQVNFVFDHLLAQVDVLAGVALFGQQADICSGINPSDMLLDASEQILNILEVLFELGEQDVGFLIIVFMTSKDLQGEEQNLVAFAEQVLHLVHAELQLHLAGLFHEAHPKSSDLDLNLHAVITIPVNWSDLREHLVDRLELKVGDLGQRLTVADKGEQFLLDFREQGAVPIELVREVFQYFNLDGAFALVLAY